MSRHAAFVLGVWSVAACGAETRPSPTAQGAAAVSDLCRAPDGTVIGTAPQWQAQRARIAAKWEAFLGRLPPPRCALEPRVVETTTLPGGIVRSLLTLQVEPGVRMRCYLFLPPGEGPCPACVCLHSTTDETIAQPAGLGKEPDKAFALDLAQRGYVTIAPENFLWRYPVPESVAREAKGYQAVARAFLEKYPGVKGMAKMVHDASCAVDYLRTLPRVNAGAIGAVGHSLGAKEVTYLMALDERVACGVSSEGGVAFEFTNYQDPWYLGPAVREPGFPLRAEEVPALIAPRAWLLIGGNSADGEKSRPYVAAVQPVWRVLGTPDACSLFVHDKGHAMPPEAREAAFKWLDRYLKGR